MAMVPWSRKVVYFRSCFHRNVGTEIGVEFCASQNTDYQCMVCNTDNCNNASHVMTMVTLPYTTSIPMTTTTNKATTVPPTSITTATITITSMVTVASTTHLTTTTVDTNSAHNSAFHIINILMVLYL